MRLFVGVIQPQTSAAAAADPKPGQAPDSGPGSVADLDGRTARHLAMLAELGQLALQMARDVARQSAAQSAAAEAPASNDNRQGEAAVAQAARPVADLGLAFARVSRSLNQTVALEGRLAAELDRRERGLAAEAEARLEARLRDYENRFAQTQQWHKLLSEAVGRAIDADVATQVNPGRREMLLADLDALLKANIEGCFFTLDFEPQVKDICKILGVTLSGDFVFEIKDEDEDECSGGGWDDEDGDRAPSNDDFKPTLWMLSEAQRKREDLLRAAWLDPNSPEALHPSNWNRAWPTDWPPRAGGP